MLKKIPPELVTHAISIAFQRATALILMLKADRSMQNMKIKDVFKLSPLHVPFRYGNIR